MPKTNTHRPPLAPRADILREVAEHLDSRSLTIAKIRQVICEYEAVLAERLARRQMVVIPGVGRITPRKRPARTITVATAPGVKNSPRREFLVPEHFTLSFRPDAALRRRLGPKITE